MSLSKKKQNEEDIIKFSPEDICSAISRNTSLTKSEVKIVMNEFVALLRNTMLSPNCPPFAEFPLGMKKEEVYLRNSKGDVKKNKQGQPLTKEVNVSIGKIVMGVRAGRKAGVHKIPAGFAGSKEDVYVTLEEDEPSFNYLLFHPTPTFEKELKEVSKRRSKAKGWRAKAGTVYYVDGVEEEEEG